MKKNVIYTAIFGGKDELLRPAYLPKGWDFVCFTDAESASHPSFKKNKSIWQVRVVARTHDDPVRDAKKYKVLPHKYLPEYDVSFWIDGNIVVRGDANKLIEEYLRDANIAVFNHAHNVWDPSDCVYDEAERLIEMSSRGDPKRYKDNPELIRKQVDRYRQEGYPEHNGLLVSMIMLRRHNEPDVVKAMEAWWKEIEQGSRRDQLSFNYVAWKTGLQFAWLPGDSRNNAYFKHVYHPEHRLSVWQRILRRVRHIV